MATRRAPIRSSSRSVKRTDRSGRNEPRTARWLSAALGMIGCILIAQPALSQYFGQNKVQYESFDFKVLRTDHFDVYFYPEERASAELAGRMAERWYARLSRYLGHELSGRQPLLLYASHPDFEQTNALSGVLGEGTGGVTEALKRRIVLPLAGPLAETDHVIGHELVHAFQYDITGEGRSVATDSPVLTRLPLWFVEGMAEYASIGPRDPQTAMWMRDATARDDLPDLGKLASNRYFPYRYGQAFLSFVAGTFGDDAIGRILQAPGRHGTIELGMKEALGADPDSVVKAWHRALHGQFDPWRDRLHPATDYGARILGEPETGRLQVGPVVSPDGRKMLLFSERDRFAINLFVIDVKTGDVLRRLSRNEVDPHFESLLFIRSAGSWAPDSRRVVFPAITRGRPELVIMDTETGERLREIRFSELGEIYDPAWSPDGRTIAFSALASGMTDLFVYDLQEDRLERWTDDPYTDLQPAWSPDGSRIALTTDRFTTDLDRLTFGGYEIGLVDVDATRSPQHEEPAGATAGPGGVAIDRSADVRIAKLNGAGPVTPEGSGGAAGRSSQRDAQWSSDGRRLYFLADDNGAPNLYRMEIASGAIEQLTDVETGISGITELSPALSVAPTGLAVFTAFERQGYAAFRVEDIDALAPIPPVETTALVPNSSATPTEADTLITARNGSARADSLALLPLDLLPPAQRRSNELVPLLEDPDLGQSDSTATRVERYRPKFSLDAIGQPFVAAGADRSGAFFGGGASVYFSDMLGNRNLALAAEGQTGSGFSALGASATYINLAHRWNWGVALQQTPYQSASFGSGFVVSDSDTLYVEQELRETQTNRSLLGLASYAISPAKRIDLSASADWISFGRELSTLEIDANTGAVVTDETHSLEAPAAIGLGQFSMAFVHDTALFGGTSPILGERYRLEVTPTVGSLWYYTALADYRRYEMPFRPLTLAGRALYYGRYGEDSADDRLSTPYVGSQSLLRGYDLNSFTASELGTGPGPTVFDRLVGTRLAVLNLEARVPPFALLGIGSGYSGPMPIELGVFYDTGVAWDQGLEPTFLGGDRELVRSFGGLGRVNLFGYAVLELDYVKPIDRPDDKWRWQFGLRAGF